MLSEVMEYFGLEHRFDRLGYFEMPEPTHLLAELDSLIRGGRLIAISGIVGCGKTTTLQRLEAQLVQTKEVVVSRSLAIDKDRVSLTTLITALFYDLSTEKDFKLPTKPEKRERMLLGLISKCRKPVVLFVDDAHALHHQTLVGLKRLIELVRQDKGTLSVVLAGHPKLKNDLRRPSLEEIGARASVFSLEGIRGYQKDYIEWVLTEASKAETVPTQLLTSEAIDFLAERLVTPLQIQQYLTLALEEAYRVGQKPVEPEIIEAVLTSGLNELEPHLSRHGYSSKIIADLLNTRTAEVRSFLHGQLPPARTQEIREQMLRIGIPL
ncbi:MAG: AAA family ATPase [Okeania sp. SIO2C9]|uniref:ExeA family protein n=1 Tax=Okeania sp. SIO2C9 TaxID=2607791 RepID=UPI0013BF22AD|nr:AAA family ATPase [Okeania sp. SIO2C9]NEQ78588.1 AAA family ATPase [Okeania sp. SIO2C9]